MKQKKLFASDFDGTLNNYKVGISEHTRKMIGKFRAEGNIFGVVTGRNYVGASWIWDDADGLLDFIMCMTGAYVMDKERKVIFESRGDGAILPELLRLMLEKKCRYLNYCDHEMMYEIPLDANLTDDSPEIMEALCHKNFTQINTAFCTEEETYESVALLNERFAGKVNPQINNTCIDMPPYGVSKGEAVGRLARYYGVSPENIFTAGDNINDITMLTAHYGFAVEGARDEVIGSAREVCFEVGDMLERVMEM